MPGAGRRSPQRLQDPIEPIILNLPVALLEATLFADRLTEQTHRTDSQNSLTGQSHRTVSQNSLTEQSHRTVRCEVCLILRCCACSMVWKTFYRFLLLCNNVIRLTLIHVSVHFHLAPVHTCQHVPNLGEAFVYFTLASHSNPETPLAA